MYADGRFAGRGEQLHPSIFEKPTFAPNDFGIHSFACAGYVTIIWIISFFCTPVFKPFATILDGRISNRDGGTENPISELIFVLTLATIDLNFLIIGGRVHLT